MRYKFPYSQGQLANLTNQIVSDAGIPLTLRQIFYQLEQKHGLVQPEYRRITKVKDKAYKLLSRRLVNARECGLVPWDNMIDETRTLVEVNSWSCPRDYIDTIKNAYKRNLLQDQSSHLEVWCEKQVAIGALVKKYQVPLVAGGGYRGKSNLYEAAKRFKALEKPIQIIYLGDFDPSGMDIDRDISTAFWKYWGLDVTVNRLFLTRDDTLHLPSKGPANKKDVRYKAYVDKWETDEAWELDALDPKELLRRVEDAICENLDMEAFENQKEIARNDEEKISALLKNL